MTATETLYPLLPAIYRIRDAREGEPLRALLAVIDAELDRVEDQITRTYENWFIETCDDWVVPYLGDALGVRGIAPLGDDGSLRAYVANTLAFRRRKGTASVLEDLARSVTSWPAAAVEMFQRLAATQALDHLVMSRVRTPDLRDGDALERLGGPFEAAAHFVDVRSVAERRGRYNIPAIALWVWRIEALAAEQSPPTADPTAGPSRFRFSPLGIDVALYEQPRGDNLSPARTTELSVPAPLRRRPIWAELEAARTALAANQPASYRFLDPADPAFRVWEIDGTGAAAEIPPDRIQICDLSAWAAGLPKARSYVDPRTGGEVDARVAVDPVLGRLAFLPETSPPVDVRVDYYHGFPGTLGGGLYERELAEIGTRARYAIGIGEPFATLAAAVAAWTTDGTPDALFELTGNGSFAVVDLAVPAGRSVELRSADEHRAVLRLAAPWRLTLGEASSLVLDGVLVIGDRIDLATSGAVAERRLTLRHATLVPGHALATDGSPVDPDAVSLRAATTGAGRLLVAITRSISGPVDLSATGEGSDLTVDASIVDAMGGASPAIAADAVTVTGSTILGRIAAGRLDGSDAIFDDVVTVRRSQEGCLRCSYLAPGSRTPHGYRCQPALALDATAAADHDDIVQRVRPRYTSRRYGTAAYAQLHAQCATEITRGASDNSEMGAWQFLHQPQREANLAAVLDEYVRFGLEVGVFKAS